MDVAAAGRPKLQVRLDASERETKRVIVVGILRATVEEKVGERSLLMAKTMGGKEWNAQEEQEGEASKGREAS